MKQWWLSLTGRERLMLLAGAMLGAAVLLYTLAWLPLQRQIVELQTTTERLRGDLTWMRQAARQLSTARAGAGAPAGAGPQAAGTAELSLAIAVERTSKSGGLQQALKRLEPQRDGSLRIWLEQAAFEQLLDWLILLRQQQQIQIVAASIDRQAEPGRVNARLQLQRNPS